MGQAGGAVYLENSLHPSNSADRCANPLRQSIERLFDRRVLV
jgi:hypothetical protein